MCGTLNPCSTGSLIYKNDQCECRRHNGAMGIMRPGCAATWSRGVCSSAPDLKEQMLAMEADKLCPPGMHACPVGRLEFECVIPALDVDNCGGCVSTGQGEACGDYPGVRGAACVEGACDVYSCHPGYALLNGQCIRKKDRPSH
ncbi:hypothetical protein DFH07DRAFT_313188 [Mycena maculata]|uniref:Protein CPL1-like domain-containing protein n=1 Tax=Mycena maculata TaxID=230809 RepID=A0AAD7NNC9_9AGAR|nr:hypothetical protein DFH07DRAFT_313188 [Mycena maculata]